MLDIGTRLELFVDDALIDTLDGKASLRLHQPTMREIALITDHPWEGNMCGGYKTYFRDDDRFRMYYQAWHGVFTTQDDGAITLAEAPVRIGYLESADGIHWQRPVLRIAAFQGSTENNLTFTGIGEDHKGVHGFAPFKDTNPNCAPDARYKALGGDDGKWPMSLYALQSPDGIHWALLQQEPLVIDGAFDSQNLAFWDSLRGEYRAYVRDTSQDAAGGWYRSIRTATLAGFCALDDGGVAGISRRAGRAALHQHDPAVLPCAASLHRLPHALRGASVVGGDRGTAGAGASPAARAGIRAIWRRCHRWAIHRRT